MLKVSQLEAEKVDLRRALRNLEIKQQMLNSPRLNGPFSPRVSSKIPKLQAIVRGFMARIRARRARIHHAALSAGVLYAMKNTTQGIYLSTL